MEVYLDYLQYLSRMLCILPPDVVPIITNGTSSLSSTPRREAVIMAVVVVSPLVVAAIAIIVLVTVIYAINMHCSRNVSRKQTYNTSSITIVNKMNESESEMNQEHCHVSTEQNIGDNNGGGGGRGGREKGDGWASRVEEDSLRAEVHCHVDNVEGEEGPKEGGGPEVCGGDRGREGVGGEVGGGRGQRRGGELGDVSGEGQGVDASGRTDESLELVTNVAYTPITREELEGDLMYEEVN